MKTFKFKWLLLSIILSIACINNTWATDYYLRYQKDMPAGNYDGNTSQKLTQFGSTNRYYCELSLSGSSSYGFYIRVDNDEYKCWKTDATASTNQEIGLTEYGGKWGNSNHRVTYTTGSAGTYIFTYDINNHKISVSPKSSQTVKVAWSIASGHDGDYNLGTYTTLSQEGSTAKYSADVDISSAAKHYMFVQTDGNRYWKGTSAVSAGSYAYVYDYGTNNYGNSGDKLNFTPSATGKYRFTWDHDAKMVTYQRVYKVTYNANGSTSGSKPSDSYHPNGATVTAASNSGSLAKSNYSFGGWNTANDGSGTNYTAGSGTFTMSTSTITLYAKWTQGTTVDKNGGSANTTYTATWNKTSIAIASAPTRAGYTLNGYYAESGCSNKIAAANGNLQTSVTIGGTVWTDGSSKWAHTAAAATIYAGWTAKTYSITLHDNNGGSNNGSATATYDGGLSSVSAPTKSGYHVVGYYKEAGMTNKIANADGSLCASTAYTDESSHWTNDGAVTLYAKWEEDLSDYTLTYGVHASGHGTLAATYTSSGSSVGSSPATVTANAGVTMTATPSSYYEVEGWYNSSACTSALGGWGTTNPKDFTMDNNYTIYVKFQPIAYTITYNLNDGTNDPGNPTSYNYESSTITLGNATRSGYTFLGWYGNSSFTGDPITEIAQHSSGDKTFWAKWGKNSTITLNDNSGSGGDGTHAVTQYLPAGDLTSAPVRANCVFDGYYTGSGGTGTKIYNSDLTPVSNVTSYTDASGNWIGTSDITLYARWIGFTNLTVKPSTLHTGAKTDTIVVGDAITITPMLSNAPSPHSTCASLYLKEEGQWIEQSVTFGGTDTKTIAAKPLAGSKPLPAGEYKVVLSLRNGSTCSASEIVSIEKVFYIGEQAWYIYGGAFWGWPSNDSEKEGMKNITTTNGDGIQLLFLPTATTGQYYYGPFQFKNENEKDYTLFRIYDKINHKDIFAQADGNFWVSSSNNESNKITLKSGSLTFEHCFYANGLSGSDYYLYIQDGKMWVSTTRPVLAPKIRMKIVSGGNNYWTNEVTLSNGNPRKISFYRSSGTATITTERFLLGVGWTSTPAQVALTLDNSTYITKSFTAAEKGVYVADLTWDASNDHVAISNVVKYNGDYYIRTKHSTGGWDNYKQTANLFTYSDYTKAKEGYTHYFMKWVEAASESDRNVKFDVANEYNSSLSKDKDGFAEDAYANGYGNLKQNANVRFMYNDSTNTLSRAYLSGSASQSDYFLVLKGNASNCLYTNEAKTIHHTTNGTADWAFFDDTKNWVYQVEVFATPGTRIKLTAQFTNKSGSTATQYFKGADGSGSYAETYTEALLGGSGTTAYQMRVVYDFKTNRLISAWEPGGTISGHIENVDVMLERYKQNAATQIKFAAGDGNDLTAKNIIGAIRFAYNDLKGKVGTWSNTTRPLLKYFISFPFDVNISDLFGLNSAYGDAYVIMRYDGAERAEKGFFRGDGTETFWKEMEVGDKMEKNVGYCLILDNDYFNGTIGHIWDDKVAGNSVYLYFPSSGNVGLINGNSETISVPSHECTINRPYTDPESGKTLNHMNTDSHWNLMGVPVFDNTKSTADGTPGNIFLSEYDPENPFCYYYGWQPDNTFIIANAADTTFKAMHSYMVQYHGDVVFTGSAPASSVAARKAPLNGNYKIELRALNSDKEMLNRTYIELREDAHDDFELNEDVYMSLNTRAVNIYTFAGDYDVAANVLSVGKHSVPVGLKVRTAGTYSITMPSAFSGTAILLDKQTGERTNLAISDFDVELPKGVINDRFVLEIDGLNNTITDIEFTTGEGSIKDGKAHKFIENGIMYILQNGAIYDAQGQRVQ